MSRKLKINYSTWVQEQSFYRLYKKMTRDRNRQEDILLIRISTIKE